MQVVTLEAAMISAADCPEHRDLSFAAMYHAIGEWNKHLPEVQRLLAWPRRLCVECRERPMDGEYLVPVIGRVDLCHPCGAAGGYELDVPDLDWED